MNRYRREQFETTNSPATVFSSGWWLDAVTRGSWGEVLVERDGCVIARLPYALKRRFGFTVLRMPPLTQTLGPWLSASEGKYLARLAREHDLLGTLVDGLPPHHYFDQTFHHSLTNWLPFYWRGFRQTTFYTYVIEDLTDLDAVWGAARDTVRRNIRKAQSELAVRSDLGVDVLLDLSHKTFLHQGLSVPYSPAVVRQLDRVCAEKARRKMFFAEDAQGTVRAALFLVWDAASAYYLMGGVDRSLHIGGAMSLLFWEAIRFASTVTRSFDFEGSMVPSIESVFRNFGAVQKPYFRIRKASSRVAEQALTLWDWWCAHRRSV
jgi:hypothetical protein